MIHIETLIHTFAHTQVCVYALKNTYIRRRLTDNIVNKYCHRIFGPATFISKYYICNYLNSCIRVHVYMYVYIKKMHIHMQIFYKFNYIIALATIKRL